MSISCFIWSLFMVPILSKTFICTDTICDFGICTNNQCTDNTYACTSSSTHCHLECSNCNNVTIISHALDTDITCEQKHSCNNLNINIEPSETTANFNSLVLTCGHSSSCTNIYISCDNEYNLCQCKDFNDIQCNNNVHGDFSLWHSDPFIIRKSINDHLNHSQYNQINQTVPFTSQVSTTDFSISELETINTTHVFVTDNSHSARVTDYLIYALFPACFCMLLSAGTFILTQGKIKEHKGNKTEKETKAVIRPKPATIMSIISESPKSPISPISPITPNSPNSETLETDMYTINQPEMIHTIDTNDIVYKQTI